MNNFLKYILPFVLLIGFARCNNDSSKEKAAQSQQKANQLGQMTQKPAPDIDLSDKEADKFVEASINIQKVQMQAQKKMVSIIKDQGLDIKTFQKISQAQRGGKSGADNDVSDEDMKKYQKATKAMQKKQEDIQKKQMAAIEDAGMKVDRYQKISRAAQQDSVMRMRLMKKMQQQQPQGMQQGG